MENISEIMPLLPETNSNSNSFFQKFKSNPQQIIKQISLATASIFSGYMYWPSSFNAAESISNLLAYPAALGGSITNTFFNYENFLNLIELPKFRSMPWKYIIATLFSTACVAPNFFMNIYDEEKQEYLDKKYIILQLCTATLNIFVNITGTFGLIGKNPFKESIDIVIRDEMIRLKSKFENFLELPLENQTEATFSAMLSEPNQVISFALTASIGLLSIPQFIVYVFISFIGMENLAKNIWNLDKITSTSLGLITAIGNAVPGAGFTIIGVNSICKKLKSLEKPSWLALLFGIPALLSGFTTHKAAADTLKKINYSGYLSEVLKWEANLSAALLYNYPQILAFIQRYSDKNSATSNPQLAPLMEEIKITFENLKNHADIKHYIKNNLTLFFRRVTTESISINDDTSQYLSMRTSSL